MTEEFRWIGRLPTGCADTRIVRLGAGRYRVEYYRWGWKPVVDSENCYRTYYSEKDAQRALVLLAERRREDNAALVEPTVVMDMPKWLKDLTKCGFSQAELSD